MLGLLCQQILRRPFSGWLRIPICRWNQTDITDKSQLLEVKLELAQPRSSWEKSYMFKLLVACLVADLPDLMTILGVAQVKTAVECNDLNPTIIHIRDWQFVDEEQFTLDGRDESDSDLSGDEVSTLFAEHRMTVETAQRQQTQVLRTLIRKLGSPSDSSRMLHRRRAVCLHEAD